MQLGLVFEQNEVVLKCIMSSKITELYGSIREKDTQIAHLEMEVKRLDYELVHWKETHVSKERIHEEHISLEDIIHYRPKC